MANFSGANRIAQIVPVDGITTVSRQVPWTGHRAETLAEGNQCWQQNHAGHQLGQPQVDSRVFQRNKLLSAALSQPLPILACNTQALLFYVYFARGLNFFIRFGAGDYQSEASST
jgi:hypothetical protein